MMKNTKKAFIVSFAIGSIIVSFSTPAMAQNEIVYAEDAIVEIMPFNIAITLEGARVYRVPGGGSGHFSHTLAGGISVPIITVTRMANGSTWIQIGVNQFVNAVHLL